jgi:hypothetical protein
VGDYLKTEFNDFHTSKEVQIRENFAELTMRSGLASLIESRFLRIGKNQGSIERHAEILGSSWAASTDVTPPKE